MEKLVRGLIDFQRRLTPRRRRELASIALGQQPDAFLVSCCDSRVAPNVFVSTQPGDVFVLRNVGNLIPRWVRGAKHGAPRAVGAALEYAVQELHVRDIVVCGHSQCGAMLGALGNRQRKRSPHLVHWLEQIKPTIQELDTKPKFARGLPEHDRLSQLSVSVQLRNLMTYRLVADQVKRGNLQLHGWWFDLAAWHVLAFDQKRERFSPITKGYLDSIVRIAV